MKNLYLLLFVCVISLASCAQGEKSQRAVIETEFGNMTVELYNSTPKHRDNFIKLVNEKFYDDLLFHRIIKDFMIQGGDPNSRGAAPGVALGSGGPGYLIDNEIGAPHLRGTLAAARTGGPSNPDKKSSGSQFYIVQGIQQSDKQLDSFESRKRFKYNETQRKLYKERGGRPDLDGEYTVFGEVVEGMEVIDKIAAVEKAPGDRPVKDVKMKIRLVNQ